MTTIQSFRVVLRAHGGDTYEFSGIPARHYWQAVRVALYMVGLRLTDVTLSR